MLRNTIFFSFLLISLSNDPLHLGRTLCLQRRSLPRLLLLPALPFQKNGNEVLEIKLGPHALQEEDLGVLVALPEHEVTETFDAAGAHKDI